MGFISGLDGKSKTSTSWSLQEIHSGSGCVGRALSWIRRNLFWKVTLAQAKRLNFATILNSSPYDDDRWNDINHQFFAFIHQYTSPPQ